MGSKNKLRRFRENETFSNVLQPLREEIVNGYKFQGAWNEVFKNDNPIYLELGCGKGEYTVDLARKNPDINYIGIDIKGARFWRGAKTALEENMENVRFIRTQIELVDQVFAVNEVSEIWITFPDPQIKFQRTKHRMTNPDFLNKYRKILKKEGLINLKTDSEFMFGYTLGLLQGMEEDIQYAHHDIYKNTEAPQDVIGTQTFYEKQYLEIDKKITYLKFRLKQD
ncbi:MAG: tRNA (guanosine(46)-N7)-methyltransferase TrmB [Nonlabens sp.]